MKCGGIITAAGLSSRMGAFKPLLELNGYPMIVHTVLSMKNAGVDPVCVVVGYRGEELKPVLEPLGVLIAENRDPAGSDMLASVRIGWEAVSGCDAVFLLPADMPLIAPSVFRELQHGAEREDPLWAVATVSGKSRHPALLTAACRSRVMEYRGDGGLRAAMEGIPPLRVEAGDEEMNRDADRPEDLAAIRQTALARMGLSEERCLLLWDRFETPDHVRRHCAAVAELAEAIACDLIAAGGAMDTLLCRSAGLLHDMLRTAPHHAREAEKVLRELGFDRLAAAVGGHMSFQGLPDGFSELTVVCLADKLVREEERVSPAERYGPAMEKYPAGTPAGDRIREDRKQAEKLCERFFLLTGKRLYR